MMLRLIRSNLNEVCTIGRLYIHGEFQCYTLEDKVRLGSEKVYGETAIPYGEYQVDITFSKRFQRNLPILLNVPNFEGVRIHPGNTDKDTEGCILVGTTVGPDEKSILHSRDAFNALYPLIQASIQDGERCFIAIQGSEYGQNSSS